MPSFYNTARAQAHELHQLLDISAELGSIGQLDEFLQQFVLRAADFLGFGRGFIDCSENESSPRALGGGNGQPLAGGFHVSPGLPAKPFSARKSSGRMSPPNSRGQPGDAGQVRRAALTVPLLDTEGEVLGKVRVLDRLDHTGISQEEIRRARALAAQVAVAMEVTRNLHQSEQHRRRAESLMALALELNGHLRLRLCPQLC